MEGCSIIADGLARVSAARIGKARGVSGQAAERDGVVGRAACDGRGVEGGRIGRELREGRASGRK
uniref:Uncharacterized protein n=1 Tax=Arundo donax TaxID=35708 RepID=A0A0A9GGS9_ARUDO